MIHLVISVNRYGGKVTYLSAFKTADQAYADAMVYCATTHGVWHPIVDKQEYVNELLDEVLRIKPCPLQG